MGLAYLNKKSWHTGTFTSIEKVWLAENKSREDQRKAAERAKKLKEERQNEELKRLQVEAGLLPASVLDRQDWIYEWGNKVQDQSKEDYLLGKPVQEKETPRDSRRYPFTPLLKETSANPKNEAFVKLHEDPLFMIKQEEMKRRTEIINNPLKMRVLYKEIEEKPLKKKKHKRDRSNSAERRRHKRKSSRRQEAHSRSRSESRSQERRHKDHKEASRRKSSSLKTSMFNEYLKKKLGPNVTIDDDAFKPDFNINRKKEKGSQMSHEERMKMVSEIKQIANDLSKMKLESNNKVVEEDHPKEKDGSIFIQKMRNDVYGKDTNINDLGDHMARNVHSYTKGADETKNS